MLLLLRMPVVAVVGAEARRPVALMLLLKLLLLKLLLLAVLEAPVPADGVGGGAASGGAALRGVAADVHGAGVRVAAAAAGDARHPGAATDHPGGDVLLVAVLHVHDELPGAVAAAAVARQKRLPPRRRLGLLVEVFGLLQLILPRLQKK